MQGTITTLFFFLQGDWQSETIALLPRDGLRNTPSATDSPSLGFHAAAREGKAFQNMFVRQQESAKDTQGQT